MSHLNANWPAPSHIKAITTSRLNGKSPPLFDNNLALHVGDDANQVHANRLALRENFSLPEEPFWLEQTHSNCCVFANEGDRKADAAIARYEVTRSPLVIMTADCLPIVLCNRDGTEIAAIHAGWRGLANGIIENTIKKMTSSPHTLLAWIGPAICQKCYEIGPEVEETFNIRYPFSHIGFEQMGSSRYADLPKIASLILRQCGILEVYDAQVCSFEQKEFYSYRREGQTGRMATLIWFKS